MEYVLKENTRSRSIRVRVNTRGEVEVSVPPRTPKNTINSFLEQSQEWIHRMRARIQRNSVEEDIILHEGQLRKIQISTTQSERVLLTNNTISIRPTTYNAESVTRALLTWQKARAEEALTHLVSQCAKKTGVTILKLRFLEQKTRWGSCTSDLHVQLNWLLIRATQEVQRYVVIHELAHTVHHDHSKSFWQYVARFDPQYAENRKWLQRNATQMHHVPQLKNIFEVQKDVEKII